MIVVKESEADVFVRGSESVCRAALLQQITQALAGNTRKIELIRILLFFFGFTHTLIA
jgi:hypothetical protein